MSEYIPGDIVFWLLVGLVPMVLAILRMAFFINAGVRLVVASFFWAACVIFGGCIYIYLDEENQQMVERARHEEEVMLRIDRAR